MKPEQSEPNNAQETFTEATDTILVVAAGKADTTIRPRRPNIPLTWPRPTPPLEEETS